MSRLHAFVQKRQLLFIQLVLLSCTLAACALDQHAEPRQRIVSSCEQHCGTNLSERAFVCIDHCHFEADRTSLP
jgi:hypothetical protein